jgi:hypothetical protein
MIDIPKFSQPMFRIHRLIDFVEKEILCLEDRYWGLGMQKDFGARHNSTLSRLCSHHALLSRQPGCT